MISNEDYELVQSQICMIGVLLADLPIEGFIERANLALAVGPVLHPSAWIAGNKKLEELVSLANAALGLKNAVLAARERAGLAAGMVVP